MAHLGRAYPLTRHRFINADASYPSWAALTYRVSLPPATGILGVYLSSMTKITGPPVVMALPAVGLQWEWTENIIAELTFIWTRFEITYDDFTPSNRLFTIHLDYFQSFPPASGTLQTFEARVSHDQNLDTYALSPLLSPFPTVYDPQDAAVFRANGW